MAINRRFAGKGQGLALPSMLIPNERGAGSDRAGYNPTLDNDDTKPQVRYGSMQTYERPLRLFPGDFDIPAGVAGIFNVPIADRTVFARFINVQGAFGDVTASINGGGFRKILNLDFFNNTEIDSIQVQVTAVGGCTVQTAQI